MPRTFVGAIALSNLFPPNLVGSMYGQTVVRAVLGLFNAIALVAFKDGLESAYGKNAGRWYALLQMSQFHVIYYASRTLPNMFAFGLSMSSSLLYRRILLMYAATFAFRCFLPTSSPAEAAKIQTRQRLGIFLFVFSGVVFRSEIAILLFAQLFYMLIYPRISLQTMVPAGLSSAGIALVISVLVDSYFWGRPIWPELAGFYFNAIQGKSEEWGTSPLYYYFTSLLPKLLLNPIILLILIPIGLVLPTTKYAVREMVVPSFIFVAIYSLQPHKEARFIIYAVPPLTAAASLSASYIWTRKSKTLLYRVGSLVLLASVLGSFVASTAMLFISSLNYPGGEALSQLHSIIEETTFPTTSILRPPQQNISIHMDVLSCMTGVTRFQQYSSRSSPRLINSVPTFFWYDKTENETRLLEPEFWEQFDYALTEQPEKAIGKWEVVGIVSAYAGIEVVRPGSLAASESDVENVYAANNVSKDGEVRSSEEVRNAVEHGVKSDGQSEMRSFGALRRRVVGHGMSKSEFLSEAKFVARRFTGGWWVGPRMEPKIRILKRVKEPFPI